MEANVIRNGLGLIILSSFAMFGAAACNVSDLTEANAEDIGEVSTWPFALEVGGHTTPGTMSTDGHYLWGSIDGQTFRANLGTIPNIKEQNKDEWQIELPGEVINVKRSDNSIIVDKGQTIALHFPQGLPIEHMPLDSDYPGLRTQVDPGTVFIVAVFGGAAACAGYAAVVCGWQGVNWDTWIAYDVFEQQGGGYCKFQCNP